MRDWFHANKLTLNINKSSYLLFEVNRTACTKLNLSLNGFDVPRVNHAKFLGTWLGDKLNWDIHISKLVLKLKCGLGMLRRSNNLLSSSAKKLLYYGQIHSNLCYCLGVWGSMLSKKLCKQLLRMQCAAISLIDPTVITDKLFQKHNILTFDKLVCLEQLKIGYKLCNNLLPTNYAALIRYDHRGYCTDKKHNYYTRNKHIPNLPLVQNSKYKSSFLFCAVREYSSVGSEISDSQSLKTFVMRCKKYLLCE